MHRMHARACFACAHCVIVPVHVRVRARLSYCMLYALVSVCACVSELVLVQGACVFEQLRAACACFACAHA
jgi:hypothetical protein